MMLQKLLLKQKQTFHPDDERIATTLRMLATLRMIVDRTKKLSSYFGESVAINKLYAGDVMAIQQLNGIISEILKGEGRENEAKLVAVPKIGWVAPELLRKIGRTKEADQIEHDGDVPDYIDPNRIEIHNLRPTDPSNEIITLQKELQEKLALAPYGEGVNYSAAQLMPLLETQHDWKELKRVSSIECDIYERRLDRTGGRSRGCLQRSDTRLTNYSRLANAEFELGDTRAAAALHRPRDALNSRGLVR